MDTDPSMRVQSMDRLRHFAKFEPREIVLTVGSAFGGWAYEDLAAIIAAFFDRTTPPQRLTLDLKWIQEHRWDDKWSPISMLESPFKMCELVLIDLSVEEYGMGCRIVGEAPCKDGWDMVPWLCEYADVVRFIDHEGERVIKEKPIWVEEAKQAARNRDAIRDMEEDDSLITYSEDSQDTD